MQMFAQTPVLKWLYLDQKNPNRDDSSPSLQHQRPLMLNK